MALFRLLPRLARSVVVSGKHRRAATGDDSRCLPGLGYPASDPSHNADDAFNVVSMALLRLEAEEAEEEEQVGVEDEAGEEEGEEEGQGEGELQAGAVMEPAVEPQEAAAAERELTGVAGDTAGAIPRLRLQPRPSAADPSQPHARQPLQLLPPRVVFLQLHGKADASCPYSTVFASGGFGRNASAFYGRSDTAVAAVARALGRAAAVAAAAKAAEAEAVGSVGGDEAEAQVKAEAVEAGLRQQQQGLGWAVHLPPDDPACPLAATRNVFGRVVNGVPRCECCGRPADEGGPVAAAEEGAAEEGAAVGVLAGGGRCDVGSTGSWSGGGRGRGRGGRSCFGAFVHVEQAAEARDPEAWGVWAEALAEAVAVDGRGRGG